MTDKMSFEEWFAAVKKMEKEKGVPPAQFVQTNYHTDFLGSFLRNQDIKPVVARSSSGKSEIGMNYARMFAMSGIKVVVFQDGKFWQADRDFNFTIPADDSHE